MNITKNLTIACSLGLLAALGSATLGEGTGDPRVRVVEFPEDSSLVGNLYFSNDSSVFMLQRYRGADSEIYIHEQNEWVLIREEVSVVVPGFWPAGLSADGSVYGMSDGFTAEIVSGRATVTPPRVWHETDEMGSESTVFGSIGGGSISGDGNVIALSGQRSGSLDSVELLWHEEGELINISDGLPREGHSYSDGILSTDGSVMAFSASFYAPINNIRSFWTNGRQVWVWTNQDLTSVPPIDPGYEVLMRLRGISGNGQAVIGTAQGVWFDGFGDQNQLSDEEMDDHMVQSPDHAWIWTRETGTVEIADPDRFADVRAMDITDDAELVLGGAVDFNEDYHQFLWYRVDNQFIMLDDLFARLRISIDADWYGFEKISSDGSKLMGVSQLDGQYSALIVTIPVRNGDLSIAKP